MHNFKELEVWKKSISLSVEMYKLLQLIPVKDQYYISSQLMRSAISIPSNIAEGAGKNSNKDFANFLSISTGSSFELETQLIIINKIHPQLKENINPLLIELTQIQRMIYSLRKNKLSQKQPSEENK